MIATGRLGGRGWGFRGVVMGGVEIIWLVLGDLDVASFVVSDLDVASFIVND